MQYLIRDSRIFETSRINHFGGSKRHVRAAPATAVPDTTLQNQTKPGIASFLQNNENYTTFLSFVQSDPVYYKLLKGDWAQVSFWPDA